jgi:hypothetical protein
MHQIYESSPLKANFLTRPFKNCAAMGVRLFPNAYPPAPTSFEDLIQLIPPRGANNRYRFNVADRPFEL